MKSFNLNAKQREAVETLEGPLLILAGAGSGKTKTIVERIVALIRSGVNPSEILAITFTNKAAREMRERVEKAIEKDDSINLPVSVFERPFVSTFHSLAVHILRENSVLLGIPRHFKIFGRDDSISAVRNSLKDAGFDPKQFEPGKLLSLISKQKNKGIGFAEYDRVGEEGLEYMDRIILEVWRGYNSRLKKEKAFDFDDLLLVALKLLSKEETLLRYQKVWKYVHIDEYQDTNSVQYEIVKKLVSKTRNVCAVGDLDQSIYHFRGADYKNMLRFEKDYPNAKTIMLEENYRSTKNILKAANTIIEKNTLRKDKNLFTSNETGEKISLAQGIDEDDEARGIATEAEKLITQGAEPREIAVLYRANFQSRALESAFLAQGVPYQVVGTRFFERKEVKDVLSYLHAALRPESETDFSRAASALSRGIGKTTLLKVYGGLEHTLPVGTREKVVQFRNLLARIKETAETKSASEVIAFVINEGGFKTYFEEKGGEEGEERLQNLYELFSLSEKYNLFLPGESIEMLLSDATLASDQDDLEKNDNVVRLMTVHASKGLEFDYIFISGLEERLFPHERIQEGKGRKEERSIEEDEEERRLFYVALTRARKKLFLSYAASRNVFGEKRWNFPSQFISDISSDLFEKPPEKPGKVVYLDD